MQENKELTTKEKARLMKNAYQREWARKNPDKVKASMERHYAKKYDEMIEQMIKDFAEDNGTEEIDRDLVQAVGTYEIAHDLERGGDLRE